MECPTLADAHPSPCFISPCVTPGTPDVRCSISPHSSSMAVPPSDLPRAPYSKAMDHSYCYSLTVAIVNVSYIDAAILLQPCIFLGLKFIFSDIARLGLDVMSHISVGVE
ncbi:hypothetical protein SCOCK_690004 [Actinacidiphila cocklensis]|uniref:Uncharacterized protein n=1 Tax=Actinacidiphila cocklensis TaxID=887465 RepID=A0A9W4E2L0_9ACTN|nr:hypothetical protein SCOCK_690004 [Actinacidiphila cocklensis]